MRKRNRRVRVGKEGRREDRTGNGREDRRQGSRGKEWK